MSRYHPYSRSIISLPPISVITAPVPTDPNLPLRSCPITPFSPTPITAMVLAGKLVLAPIQDVREHDTTCKSVVPALGPSWHKERSNTRSGNLEETKRACRANSVKPYVANSPHPGGDWPHCKYDVQCITPSAHTENNTKTPPMQRSRSSMGWGVHTKFQAGRQGYNSPCTIHDQHLQHYECSSKEDENNDTIYFRPLGLSHLLLSHEPHANTNGDSNETVPSHFNANEPRLPTPSYEYFKRASVDSTMQSFHIPVSPPPTRLPSMTPGSTSTTPLPSSASTMLPTTATLAPSFSPTFPSLYMDFILSPRLGEDTFTEDWSSECSECSCVGACEDGWVDEDVWKDTDSGIGMVCVGLDSQDDDAVGEVDNGVEREGEYVDGCREEGLGGEREDGDT